MKRKPDKMTPPCLTKNGDTAAGTVGAENQEEVEGLTTIRAPVAQIAKPTTNISTPELMPASPTVSLSRLAIAYPSTIRPKPTSVNPTDILAFKAGKHSHSAYLWCNEP